MFAPVLTVYLLAIVALTASPTSEVGEAPPTFVSVPTESTVEIKHAIIQFGEKRDKGDSIPWGTILTGVFSVVVAYMAGRFALATTQLQEKRLRVEAFNKSAELMKRKKDEDVGTNEGSALTFSLIKLGEYDFALEMIRTLWPENGITSTAAVWAINEILELKPGFSSSTNLRQYTLKSYAANALWLNAMRLFNDKDGYYEWPKAFEWKWDTSVSEFCQEAMIQAFAVLLASRSQCKWRKCWIDPIIYTLNIARTKDTPKKVQYCASRLLKAISGKYARYGEAIKMGDGQMTLKELTLEVKDSTAENDELMCATHFMEVIHFLESPAWDSGPKESLP